MIAFPCVSVPRLRPVRIWLKLPLRIAMVGSVINVPDIVSDLTVRFDVEEEERLVVAVVNVRNHDRPAEAAAEVVLSDCRQ